MSETPTLTAGLQHRDLPTSIEIRSEGEGDGRTIAGIGVPYNSPIEMFGIREQFAPGSVTVAEGAKLLWRHNEPIGRITEHSETEAGWFHRSRVSKTSLGEEALTLIRDDVIDRFSIGFEPIEHLETQEADGSLTITHTKVLVREVSLVPFPAYAGAELTEIRNAPQHSKGNLTMPETTVTAEDVTEIRSGLEDVKRSIALLRSEEPPAPEPAEERSAGAILKAAVSGDEIALASLNRATAAAFSHRDYDGGTTADAIAKDAWVGDLTRIVDGSTGIRHLFATGPLPKEGMNIEYGQLKANTLAVAEQAAEGDDLAMGGISVETKTAPVKTYGGYTKLSRQEIERSSVNMVNLALRGMASAANKAQNTAFQTHFAAAVSAQRTANNTVDVPTSDATYIDWLDAVVEAAVKFEDMELPISGLIVSKAVFKELIRLNTGTDGDGRPLFAVSGSGVNTVGSLDVTALRGDLANVAVYMNTKATGSEASFFNTDAIRTYESGLARLQDENIVNLSSAFSVYRYAAIANEIPAGLVPVKRTGA